MTDTSTGYTPTEEDEETARAAVRVQALDRFTRDVMAEDARDWLAGFAARAVLSTIAPIVERERRAAKAEALREFSEEMHDRAGHLNGGRKSEAWFVSDRAYNRAAEIERGE